MDVDRERIPVVVVTAPACHFCDDAERVLAERADPLGLQVRLVPIDSVEGARLVTEHRPALSPLVLVDGAFFSSGRLPRRKLEKLVAARRAAAVVGGR
ncbi:glutaredoxin [Georgenia sp. SUBG003]|uniref:glutaredoxin n=1 Tax=Georgenia sp. SUBG003 TaxID=1497974 RepID=UPI0004D660E6|nr:glutaredoxin [Georgenia sp. SUBG003]